MNQQVNVFFAVIAIFIGDFMGSQKSWHDGQRHQLAQFPQNPQTANFVLQGQAVSRFGFDGCGAIFQKGHQAMVGAFGNFIIRGFAKRPHAVADAATCRGNFFVGLALRAHHKFMLAGSVKNGMGMRIHKTGQCPATFPVHLSGFGIFPAQFRSVANFDDGVIMDQNTRVRDDVYLKRIRLLYGGYNAFQIVDEQDHGLVLPVCWSKASFSLS